MRTITSVCVATLLTTTAWAHTAYVESDFTYEPITSPEMSKLVIGYLEEGEVDMYQVLITPEDLTPHYWGPNPVNLCMITANATPPVCQQYKKFHPSVALIGPGLPAPTEELPFEVPPGYGVIVAHNPKDNSVDRPIYTEHPDAFNAEIDRANASGCSIDNYMTENLSWYLPYGLTQECLHCSQWTCDFSNSLGVPIFFPGMFYLAVFDPTNRVGDYSLTMGTGEGENTCEEIQHTADVIEGIIDGSVYRKNNCVSAGESDYECCDLNRNNICDADEGA